MPDRLHDPDSVQLAAPPLGYFFGLLTPAQRVRVLKQIAKEGGQQFRTMYEAAKKGLGLSTPPPADRLAFYTNQPRTMAEVDALVQLFADTNGEQGLPFPSSWEELELTFPDAYEKDMRDWERLLVRAGRGEIDLADDDDEAA